MSTTTSAPAPIGGAPGGPATPAATTTTTTQPSPSNGQANGQANGSASLLAPTPQDRHEDELRGWLPQEYRDDPVFKALKNVDNLAKSYKHAASLVGLDRGQILKLPAEAGAPEWSDVWNRLGRPDNPDGYALNAPPGVDEKTLADFKATAHQLGISKDQAAKLMEFYGGTLNGMQERTSQAATQAQADVTAALKREWGQTYDDQLHMARRAAREVGGDSIVQLLEATQLGNHPDVVRMFAKIGQRLGEPSGLKGGGGTMNGLTPASAQQEIKQLSSDREFFKQLSDRANPGYGPARQRWDALHAAAYPTDPP